MLFSSKERAGNIGGDDPDRTPILVWIFIHILILIENKIH